MKGRKVPAPTPVPEQEYICPCCLLSEFIGTKANITVMTEIGVLHILNTSIMRIDEEFYTAHLENGIVLHIDMGKDYKYRQNKSMLVLFNEDDVELEMPFFVIDASINVVLAA